MTPGGGLGGAAGVKMEIDWDRELGRIHGRMTNLQDLLQTPRLTPIVGSIVGVNGQLAGVTIGGPEGGLEWHVRRITLAPPLQAGALVTVSTQGTIVIGRGTGLSYQNQGGGQVVANVAGAFEEITRTSTVPNALLFSRGQCAINYPHNLIVLWSSGTAGVPLQISGDALEVPQNLSSDAEA